MAPSGRAHPSRNLRKKGGEFMSEQILTERRREAWALIRKGGLSAKIARAFLKQHGVI